MEMGVRRADEAQAESFAETTWMARQRAGRAGFLETTMLGLARVGLTWMETLLS